MTNKIKLYQLYLYKNIPRLLRDVYFDTELVSKVILGLKRGKAADIDGLSCEHILFSHPSLQVIISNFFRLILNTKSIHTGFKRITLCQFLTERYTH